MSEPEISGFALFLRKVLKRLESFVFLLKSVLSRRQFLYFSCVIVGISAAFAVIVLKTFAHWVFKFANYLDGLLHLPYSNSILPVIGIVLTAWIVKKFLNGDIEKGTSHIMIAVANKSGIMPRKQMYAQIITSSLTVGMGGSAGLEAPITITGAAYGSNYAQKYRLNYKERTLLLACGVAAGIAAAFNAPIAGVLFAIEVILAEMSITAFIPIMMASATGALVSTIVLKENILLSFKSTLTFDYYNIPYYILLGILAGLVSVYHARNFRRIEHYFTKFKPYTFKRAIFGASFLAILIFFFPMLFGEGYESIKTLSSANPGGLLENTILDDYKSNEWILLMFIGMTLMIKSIATGLTLGSGGNGGNFAPSLFVGSYLGFFVAKFCHLTGIDRDLPISNFSVVGMAGVLSGLFHAPLTAIFLIAEITGGYGLMVPLLIVSSISFGISKNMEGHSMDIKSLAHTGKVFTTDKDKNVLSSIELSDLIRTDFVSVPTTAKLEDVATLLSETLQTVFPVSNEKGEFEGIIDFDKVRPIVFNAFQMKYTPLTDVIEFPKEWVSYDEILDTVLEKFKTAESDLLFVLKEKKCLGYITKVDILDTYRQKLKSLRIE